LLLLADLLGVEAGQSQVAQPLGQAQAADDSGPAAAGGPVSKQALIGGMLTMLRYQGGPSVSSSFGISSSGIATRIEQPTPGMRVRVVDDPQWRPWDEVCRDHPIVLIMGLVQTFDPLLLQEESFMGFVSDPVGRRTLIAALDAEHSRNLRVYVEGLAARCAAGAGELRAVIDPLLAEGDTGEWILSGLVDHPNMPEEVMFQLAAQGRCLGALGHRSGPRALLEILAAEFGYSEAIKTLALNYYSADEVEDEEFARFVRRHQGCFLLRKNLRQADLSPEKRRLGLEIIGADEKVFADNKR